MEIYENRNYLDLPGEEWMEIDGSPNNQVSNFGRVRTITRYVKHGTVKKIKPVICIETGKRYESSKIAALEFGTTADYIRKCCRGVIKQAGGKTWRYE